LTATVDADSLHRNSARRNRTDFSYISAHSRSAAVNVRERIERTVETLADIPEMAQAADEPGVRRMPVTSHPFVIFYAVEADEMRK
jgi:plasmid stabilization system protein ParE